MLNTSERQSWRQSWRAATVLAAMGDASTTPAFVQSLKSPNPLVRQTAARTLGDQGDATVVHHLLECLGDDDYIVRMWVIESLGKLRDQRAVDPLSALLVETSSVTLQHSIIQALGHIGDKRVAPIMLRFFNSQDRHVFSRAHEVYEQLTSSSVGG